MSRVDADRDAPRERVIVIMGTGDESVGFEPVARTWDQSYAAACSWLAIRCVAEGGDHGLTAHVDVIADVILSAAKNLKLRHCLAS